MKIVSSDAKIFAEEFPSALNVLPSNSRGERVSTATEYGETLGLISKRSVVRNPPIVSISVPRSKST